MTAAQADMQTHAARKGAPERTCIVTRKALAPGGMIRFVLGPDGVVVPDLKHALPGRGAWVSVDRASVDTAVKKQLFSRAFRQKAQATDELGALVDRLLEEAALGALKMANKAGQAVTGFTKTADALRYGKARVLLHASDGAQDGRRKLAAALKASGHADQVCVADAFTCEQLSLSLGAANVIHAAILNGGTGASFAGKYERLQRFRYGEDGNAGGTAEPAANVGVV